ncbi:hypothetical protein K474DRAFT_1112205 [Panus rudis PR-1116 ss-1]|nr:hypothetical protein K474DRAFT_1112205 [Panus rudis PR-1116 ss-1]
MEKWTSNATETTTTGSGITTCSERGYTQTYYSTSALLVNTLLISSLSCSFSSRLLLYFTRHSNMSTVEVQIAPLTEELVQSLEYYTSPPLSPVSTIFSNGSNNNDSRIYDWLDSTINTGTITPPTSVFDFPNEHDLPGAHLITGSPTSSDIDDWSDSSFSDADNGQPSYQAILYTLNLLADQDTDSDASSWFADANEVSLGPLVTPAEDPKVQRQETTFVYPTHTTTRLLVRPLRPVREEYEWEERSCPSSPALRSSVVSTPVTFYPGTPTSGASQSPYVQEYTFDPEELARLLEAQICEDALYEELGFRENQWFYENVGCGRMEIYVDELKVVEESETNDSSEEVVPCVVSTVSGPFVPSVEHNKAATSVASTLSNSTSASSSTTSTSASASSISSVATEKQTTTPAKNPLKLHGLPFPVFTAQNSIAAFNSAASFSTPTTTSGGAPPRKAPIVFSRPPNGYMMTRVGLGIGA